jgi:hypothetical protein
LPKQEAFVHTAKATLNGAKWETKTLMSRKLTLTIVGILAFLLGLVWMGQGSGFFPYPRSSFMINETPWIYMGGLLAVAGIVLFLIGRRL